MSEYGIKTIVKYLKGNADKYYDTYDLIEAHPSLADTENFIELIDEIIEAASNGEIAYYACLNSHYNDIEEYDEISESHYGTLEKQCTRDSLSIFMPWKSAAKN